MTRLEAIRQRQESALLSLQEPGVEVVLDRSFFNDIDYLLSRVERLEAALKRIRDVTEAKDDYTTSYIANEALRDDDL